MLPTIIYLIETIRRALKKSGRGRIHADVFGEAMDDWRKASGSIRSPNSLGFFRPRELERGRNAVTLHPQNKRVEQHERPRIQTRNIRQTDGKPFAAIVLDHSADLAPSGRTRPIAAPAAAR